MDAKSERRRPPQGGKGKDEGGEANPESAPAVSSAAFDLEEGIRRCFGKYEIFQKMVECLFDEADSLVTQIRAAVAGKDGACICQSAHRLRNTLLYLGAAPAGAATKRVESLGPSGEPTYGAAAADDLAAEIARLKTALAPHRIV